MLPDKDLIARLRHHANLGEPCRIAPETALRLALALERTVPWDGRRVTVSEPLSYAVELWNADRGRPYETLARCRSHTLAMAAYEAALAGGRHIMLRQGIRVFKDSRPRPPLEEPGRVQSLQRDDDAGGNAPGVPRNAGSAGQS